MPDRKWVVRSVSGTWHGWAGMAGDRAITECNRLVIPSKKIEWKLGSGFPGARSCCECKWS